VARARAVAAALLVGLLPLLSPVSEPRDLRTIERSDAPNDSLACPPGLCRAVAQVASPVLAVSADVLLARVRETLAREPRTELVAEHGGLRQLVYVQRSAVIGFPDSIRVQVVAVGEGSAAILYSRSEYGHWDFGVNEARVQRWLALLGTE